MKNRFIKKYESWDDDLYMDDELDDDGGRINNDYDLIDGEWIKKSDWLKKQKKEPNDRWDDETYDPYSLVDGYGGTFREEEVEPDEVSEIMTELSNLLNQVFEANGIFNVSIYGNEDEINIYIPIRWKVDIDDLVNIWRTLKKLEEEALVDYDNDVVPWYSKGSQFIMASFYKLD